MNNLIETFEKEQIEKLTSKKRIPAFRSGDTVRATIKIIEGERTRLQAFEGVCIGRKNNGLNSNFTLRKISHGEGVEKVFPLFSSLIDKIDIIRKGDVRRAKLYYLRDRKGKSARIVDSNRGEEADQYSPIESPESGSEEIHQNVQDTKVHAKQETDKIEKNEIEAENEVNKESSEETVEKPATAEKISTEEESESTASKAEKTEDESKS